jgi:hypothetical protein
MHYNPDNFRGVGEDIFPGVLSLNMIGVPREQPVDDTGFRPILDETADWRE